MANNNRNERKTSPLGLLMKIVVVVMGVFSYRLFTKEAIPDIDCGNAMKKLYKALNNEGGPSESVVDTAIKACSIECNSYRKDITSLKDYIEDYKQYKPLHNMRETDLIDMEALRQKLEADSAFSCNGALIAQGWKKPK